MCGGVVAGAVVGAAVNFGVKELTGGGGSSGTTSSGGGGGSGLSFQQEQMAQSVKYNEGPKFGGNKEPSISNPNMPLQPTKVQSERAASKWSINSTPSTGQGEELAKQDANDIWANRLSHYLAYNTRQLG